MWPVGLCTDFGVSSPIVQNGKVVGFYDGWSGLRKFPVDMAGFAINLQLFLNVSLFNEMLTKHFLPTLNI
jgi:beta-1,3-glucuronyltransferase